jgi:hypothetical protein
MGYASSSVVARARPVEEEADEEVGGGRGGRGNRGSQRDGESEGLIIDGDYCHHKNDTIW